MREEQGRCSDFFVKGWDPIFSTKREFNDFIPWKERKIAVLGGVGFVEAEGDDLSSFVSEYEDEVFDSSIQEVKEFMKGAASLAALEQGQGPAGFQRGAWIDEKYWDVSTNDLGGKNSENPAWEMDIVDVEQEAKECYNQKGRVTTATGIYRRLKLQRCPNPMFPNADRRLMLFRNLNPNYILALGETALAHEIVLLRDAVWKHVTFQTSIRVKNMLGYATFQMEIHIPSFELRTHSPGENPLPTIPNNIAREWTDLSFLEILDRKSPDAPIHGMRQSHFTLFICGWENRRWTGCSFVDNRDEETLEEDVDPIGGVYQDPIIDIPIADIPIWDPREYYLMALKTRLTMVLHEWTPLIRTLQRSISKYKTRHPSTLSKQFAHQAHDAKATFDWTQRTMEVLKTLELGLNGTIAAWESFSSVTGDIQYFSDFNKALDASKSNVKHSFRAIQETVGLMKDLSAVLRNLYEGCSTSSEALQLRLTLEANEAVQVSGLMTNFSISVISPVMVLIVYTSMPKGAAPFKLDTKYFLLIFCFVVAIGQLLFISFFTPWSWSKKANAWTRSVRRRVTRTRAKSESDPEFNDPARKVI